MFSSLPVSIASCRVTTRTINRGQTQRLMVMITRMMMTMGAITQRSAAIRMVR